MVLVTHDISVVAYLCDEVVVMYAGQVVESGPVREVLTRPRHPYTMGLRNAFPDLLSDALELVPIGGSPPDLREPLSGCRFVPRCPFAQPACSLDAAMSGNGAHHSACRRDSEADTLRTAALDPRTCAALVELRDVVKHFPVTRSLGEIVRGRIRPCARSMASPSTSAMATPWPSSARSGCGKTTLGRLMLKLVEPTGGAITFAGAPMAGLAGERLRDFRRQAQLVFQNPFDALNPRFTIYRAVVEPLINAGIDKAEHADRVASAFRRVHLSDFDRYFDRYPHQLSGGQLQRVVMARALVLGPRFLVADEPVSMLDVSVRAGILALLREVRETMGLDRRLHLPRPRAGPLPLRAHPGHVSRPRRRGCADRGDRAPPAPSLHPGAGRRRAGARPRPVAPAPARSRATSPTREPPSGCSFRDRCPHAMPRCAAETPLLAVDRRRSARGLPPRTRIGSADARRHAEERPDSLRSGHPRDHAWRRRARRRPRWRR